MNSDLVNRWLTLGADIGVIVGIAFLMLEIRQSSEIATVQVRLDYAAGWRSVDEARQDDFFAKIIAKSLENPQELSLHEIVQLDAYYSGVLDQTLSALRAADAGLRNEAFSVAANSIAAIYFSNEFARSWWTHVKSAWPVQLQEDLDEAIAAGELGRVRRIYEGIQNDFSRHPKS